MATHEPSPFVKLPLSDADAGELADRYNLELVPADNEAKASLESAAEQMSAAGHAYQSKSTSVHDIEPKQAVAYEPDFFLASPLTTEQTATINEHETHAIARYCVDIQQQLKGVPIVETRERFVYLPDFLRGEAESTYSDIPFHQACEQGWAGQPRQFWVRESVAARLALFGVMLAAVDKQLRIEDAFRPVGVQEGLFKRRVAWTRGEHPIWTNEEIIAEAQSKTAVTPRLASHKGGAATDATMLHRSTGKPASFGHAYPDGGALVFPRSPFVTREQWYNRQVYQVGAALSGLTLYVGEDWHVSYGDNLASLRPDGSVDPAYAAQYGPVKDFDRATGAITALYEEDEMNHIFDY